MSVPKKEDCQAMIVNQTFLIRGDSAPTEVTYWLGGSNMDQCWIKSLRFVGDMATSMNSTASFFEMQCNFRLLQEVPDQLQFVASILFYK